MFVLFLAATILLIRNAHAFLAINAPVSGGVFVIEGWIPEYDLTNFVAHTRSYSMIYTIGGLTHMAGNSTDVSDTYASVAYWHLRKVGVPAEKIRMVPSFVSKKDRTYSSAVALRDWSRTNFFEVRPFNIVTMGAHSRRSRLLCTKAFGTGQGIGVISLVNGDYDPEHWWRFSEGVKETLSESAAYLYARFLFSPD